MYVKTFLRFSIEPVIIVWFLHDYGHLSRPTEHYALVSKIPVQASELLYVLLYLIFLVDGVGDPGWAIGKEQGCSQEAGNVVT